MTRGSRSSRVAVLREIAGAGGGGGDGGPGNVGGDEPVDGRAGSFWRLSVGHRASSCVSGEPVFEQDGGGGDPGGLGGGRVGGDLAEHGDGDEHVVEVGSAPRSATVRRGGRLAAVSRVTQRSPPGETGTDRQVWRVRYRGNGVSPRPLRGRGLEDSHGQAVEVVRWNDPRQNVSPIANVLSPRPLRAGMLWCGWIRQPG